MPNKNFLLLSLEDSKIKKVSNVISNDSCRKILDHLSAKESTESELAEKLQIPISTVHYNLQQLMETGLIESKEFHYSKKGKEISHYRLTNKYIIIAPKKAFGIKEKLKAILPVALIVSGAAFVIQLASKYLFRGANSMQEMARQQTLQKSIESAAPMAITQKAHEAINAAFPMTQSIALWFLAGALFALVIYFVINTKNDK